MPVTINDLKQALECFSPGNNEYNLLMQLLLEKIDGNLSDSDVLESPTFIKLKELINSQVTNGDEASVAQQQLRLYYLYSTCAPTEPNPHLNFKVGNENEAITKLLSHVARLLTEHLPSYVKQATEQDSFTEQLAQHVIESATDVEKPLYAVAATLAPAVISQIQKPIITQLQALHGYSGELTQSLSEFYIPSLPPLNKGLTNQITLLATGIFDQQPRPTTSTERSQT